MTEFAAAAASLLDVIIARWLWRLVIGNCVTVVMNNWAPAAYQQLMNWYRPTTAAASDRFASRAVWSRQRGWRRRKFTTPGRTDSLRYSLQAVSAALLTINQSRATQTKHLKRLLSVRYPCCIVDAACWFYWTLQRDFIKYNEYFCYVWMMQTEEELSRVSTSIAVTVGELPKLYAADLVQ